MVEGRDRAIIDGKALMGHLKERSLKYEGGGAAKVKGEKERKVSHIHNFF